MKWIPISNKILKYGIFLYAIYESIVRITAGEMDRIMVVLALFPLAIIPWFVRKVIKYDLSDVLEFVYLLFVILASLLGSVLGWYQSISWWDLFVHGISGVLTSILALLILKKFSLLNRKNFWFSILFMIVFSLSVASIWEFIEFASDKFTGGDTQWVLETGVDDTMTDMLIAFVGSIVFSLIYTLLKKDNNQTLQKLEDLL